VITLRSTRRGASGGMRLGAKAMEAINALYSDILKTSFSAEF